MTIFPAFARTKCLLLNSRRTRSTGKTSPPRTNIVGDRLYIDCEFAIKKINYAWCRSGIYARSVFSPSCNDIFLCGPGILIPLFPDGSVTGGGGGGGAKVICGWIFIKIVRFFLDIWYLKFLYFTKSLCKMLLNFKNNVTECNLIYKYFKFHTKILKFQRVFVLNTIQIEYG